MDAEDRLRLAMLASDVDTFDALISSDLIFTNHLGQVFGKDDDLRLHRSGILRFDRIDPSERLVRHGAAMAIVSVRAGVAGSFGGAPFELDLRYTRVWQRCGGGWQIVAGHSSAFLGNGGQTPISPDRGNRGLSPSSMHRKSNRE